MPGAVPLIVAAGERELPPPPARKRSGFVGTHFPQGIFDQRAGVLLGLGQESFVDRDRQLRLHPLLHIRIVWWSIRILRARSTVSLHVVAVPLTPTAPAYLGRRPSASPRPAHPLVP